MTVLTRKNIKVFGVNSANNETGEIGTYKLGSAGVVFSKDPDVIQAGEWENGMVNTLQSDYAPFLEEYNSLAYTLSYFSKQQSQQGILKYDPAEEYIIGSFAVSSIDGYLYRSIQGTVGTPNINNEPSASPTYWELQDFTNKVNINGDNATFSELATIAIANVRKLTSPDYSSPTLITTTAGNTYTCTEYGIIIGYANSSSGSTLQINKDNNSGVLLGIVDADTFTTSSFNFKVYPGLVLYFVNRVNGTVLFFPNQEL